MARQSPSYALLTTDSYRGRAGRFRRPWPCTGIPLFAGPLEFPVNAIKAVEYELIGKPPGVAAEIPFRAHQQRLLLWRSGQIDRRRGGLLFRKTWPRPFAATGGAFIATPEPTPFTWARTALPAGRIGHLAISARRRRTAQTEPDGATLFGSLGIPDKAMITLELSWQRKPDFVLTLGADEVQEAKSHGIHIEVWDDDLVVVAEGGREADVTSLKKVGQGPGRIRIQAFLDQSQGRLILLSPGGKTLATLNTHPAKAEIHSGVRIRNGRGDVRLEYVRISR